MSHFGQRSLLYGMRCLYASRWNVICEMPFPSSLKLMKVFSRGWLVRSLLGAGQPNDQMLLTTVPNIPRSPARPPFDWCCWHFQLVAGGRPATREGQFRGLIVSLPLRHPKSLLA
jgi:hypothetical protein